jgi:hypothetical protein
LCDWHDNFAVIATISFLYKVQRYRYQASSSKAHQNLVGFFFH